MEKKRENTQNERDSKYLGGGHIRVVRAKLGLEHRQGLLPCCECLVMVCLGMVDVANIELHRCTLF